jgi:hypothetical protein
MLIGEDMNGYKEVYGLARGCCGVKVLRGRGRCGKKGEEYSGGYGEREVSFRLIKIVDSERKN